MIYYRLFIFLITLVSDITSIFHTIPFLVLASFSLWSSLVDNLLSFFQPHIPLSPIFSFLRHYHFHLYLQLTSSLFYPSFNVNLFLLFFLLLCSSLSLLFFYSRSFFSSLFFLPPFLIPLPQLDTLPFSLLPSNYLSFSLLYLILFLPFFLLSQLTIISNSHAFSLILLLILVFPVPFPCNMVSAPPRTSSPR